MFQFVAYIALVIVLLYAGHQIGRAIGRYWKASADRKNEEQS